MSSYRHLELLTRGPVSVVRLLNHRSLLDEEVAELVIEWNSIADDADCQTLLLDFSDVEMLNSEMLSRLILLQRRLNQKEAHLMLSNLRPEVREVLRWTKLDRIFEIQEDERPGREPPR